MVRRSHTSLHIEGSSGRKRTYQKFRTLSVLAATALGSPVSDWSLGFREKGEMIVITQLLSGRVFLSSVSALESYLTFGENVNGSN